MPQNVTMTDSRLTEISEEDQGNRGGEGREEKKKEVKKTIQTDEKKPQLHHYKVCVCKERNNLVILTTPTSSEGELRPIETTLHLHP